MTERDENFSFTVALAIFSVGLGEMFGAAIGWMYLGLALLVLTGLRVMFK